MGACLIGVFIVVCDYFDDLAFVILFVLGVVCDVACFGLLCLWWVACCCIYVIVLLYFDRLVC